MLGRPAQVLAARGLQAELWAELGLKVPSQKRLDTIGSSLRAAMTEADSTFTHLLRLNPSGVPIIRRYSTFLAEVRPSILRDFFSCSFPWWFLPCDQTWEGRREGSRAYAYAWVHLGASSVGRGARVESP